MCNKRTILVAILAVVVCSALGYMVVVFMLRGGEEISLTLRRLEVGYSSSREQQAPASASDNISLGELFERLDRRRRTADHSVHNWDRFGPLQLDTPTLVVLAHRDTDRLRYLILSLARVRNIQSTLLVFSHSFYDERIDDLVNTIDFCLVKQIYYPNSVQLYPTVFPGPDIGDCNNESRYCTRRARDPRRSEGKHHWWWTAHIVFGQRWPWFKGHRGMVTFIREDSYVLPDLVHMMPYAERALSHIPEVEVISFGGPRARAMADYLDYNKFSISIWEPIYENGFALNVSTWAKISSRSVEFCHYDDTSWSYSLQAVFGQWPRGRALTAASVAPRVLSTGRARAGRLAATELRAAMFPRDVHALVLYDTEGMRFEYRKLPPRGNGGWTDYRDHNLCLEPLVDPDTDTDYYYTTTSPNSDTIQTISRL